MSQSEFPEERMRDGVQIEDLVGCLAPKSDATYVAPALNARGPTSMPQSKSVTCDG